MQRLQDDGGVIEASVNQEPGLFARPLRLGRGLGDARLQPLLHEGPEEEGEQQLPGADLHLHQRPDEGPFAPHAKQNQGLA